MAWNKVGTRLLAVYAGRAGAGDGQPWQPPALPTSHGAPADGIHLHAARHDFAALRKRIGKPAAHYRSRILLTLG